MALMDTRVTTVEGVVEGVRGRAGRRGTISWRGIPYALPPIGKRRFRAPEPVRPWPGIRRADGYGNSPIQDRMFTATTRGFNPAGEDCLTLNVWTPEYESVTSRPVMVFFYGGAFILGGTSTPIYDGSNLARDRDVIVVTVNYRVSTLGFLDLTPYSTDERVFDNNMGIRDQVAGLEWVQRNIAAFGGDPDRVTIFGESAGGTSVLSLLSCPSAEGLFARAISQSPAPDLIVRKENAEIFADEFLRLLTDPERRAGAERTEEPFTAEEVARLVDSSSAMDLHEAGNRLLQFARHAGLSDPLPMAPVIDGDFLPQTPVEAAMSGNTLPVPLIIGSNRDEGELFARFWNIMPDSSQLLVGVHDPEIREEIELLYNGPRDTVRLAADATFWIPTTLFARFHAAQAPTYVYRFDFAPALLKLTGMGATHATELFTVFGSYRTPLIAPLSAGSRRAAKQVTATMQSRWTWFARTGTPSPEWTPYSADDRQVFIIDADSRMESDPDGQRRAAWERAHLAISV